MLINTIKSNPIINNNIINYNGIVDGIVDGDKYNATITMQYDNSANLLFGYLNINKMPLNFHPTHLSFTNASQNIAILIKQPQYKKSIADFVEHFGDVHSVRYYTFPGYPKAYYIQYSLANLLPYELQYKTTIYGVSTGLPNDIIEIKPYIQYISTNSKIGLRSFSNTTIISASHGELTTNIYGYYTFKNFLDFSYDFNITHNNNVKEIIGDNKYSNFYIRQYLQSSC